MGLADDVATLMQQVERGRALHVAKTADDGRTIVAISRFGRTALELPLAKDDYEKVVADFMRALAARSGDDLDVLAKADHFGWSIKVMSGFFGQRVSRIFVSRRHFDILEAELNARRRATAAAAAAKD